jgi:hypothetical protein
MNYVVFDTLLDFYSSEMSVSIGGDNTDFIDLAESIMKIVLSFIRSKGGRLLKDPEGLCGYLFDKLLKTDYDPWEERTAFSDEDIDDSEGEEWKQSCSDPEKVISEYLKLKTSENGTAAVLLKKFEDYITEFLDISSVEELTIEDIKEFISVVAVNEMILDDNCSLKKASDIFSDFSAYLDYNFKTKLTSPFTAFSSSMFPEIERTYQITEKYRQHNPLIEHLLSSKKDDPSLVDGFFEIMDKFSSSFELEDIHLKIRFHKVCLDSLNTGSLKKGDVLHAQLIKDGPGWQLIHLEMVYPVSAKSFLF